MGAFFIASMSTFTSCKDYDDDINSNKDAITALKQQVQALQDASTATQAELTTAKSTLQTAIDNLDKAVKAAGYQTAADVNTIVDGKGFQTANDVKGIVEGYDYATKKYVDDAVKDLATVAALTTQVTRLEGLIAEAKGLADAAATKAELQELSTKIDALNPTLNQLATAIDSKADKSALDAKADKSDLDSKADKTALDSKADKSALDAKANQSDLTAVKSAVEDANTGLKAVNSNLDAQKKLIDEVQKALSGKSSSDELNKLAKTVETLQKEVGAIPTYNDETIKGQISDLNKLLEEKIKEMNKLNEDLGNVQKELSNTPTLDELRQAMTDAENKIINVAGELSILNIFVEKGLTSIVLKPTNYIGGIEAINLPLLVRQPEIFLDPNVAYKAIEGKGSATYGSLLDPRSYDVIGTDRFVNLGTWTNPQWKQISGSEKYVCVADEYTRGDYLESFTPLQGTAYQTVEGIHWPENLNMLATTLAAGLWTNWDYALYRYIDVFPQGHAYYHLNPSTAGVDGAAVKFYTNYPEVTMYQTVTRALSEPETIITPVSATASNSQVKNGIIDIPFNTDWQTFVNTYVRNFVQYGEAKNQVITGANGYLAGSTLKVPFVAAQITKNNRVITSDYAALVPNLMQIIALADNDPNTAIAKRWSKDDGNEVEKNHLYPTPAAAIDGEATHELVYNDEVGFNLDEVVEAHYADFGAYLTRDRALTPELMKELSLSFEYVLVDWWSNNYDASQSAHATIDAREDGHYVVAHAVDAETGATQADQQAISSVGKQPLVRAMLIYTDSQGGKHILHVGYIKFVITEKVVEPKAITINLNNVFMDCPGLAVVKWSQMERLVYDQINLSKTQFEALYKLDTNLVGNYWGARRFIADNDANPTAWYDEATYVKEKEHEYKTTALTIEDLFKKNLKFATDYYKAFAGFVGYTGEELPFTGLSDFMSNQDNVLYWGLGVERSATAHTYMDGTLASADVDNAYIQYIAGVNEAGVSTKDVSTWVRFIRRDGSGIDPLYIKLTIPAGQLRWAAGQLTNHKVGYWYQYQTQNRVTDAMIQELTAPNAHSLEVHVNAPIQKGAYTELKETDFIADLSMMFNNSVQFNFLETQKKTNLAGLESANAAFLSFTKNANSTKTNLTNADHVAFWFTFPSVDKKNADFSADYVTNNNYFDSRALKDSFRYQGHAIKVWQVRGYSGKKYTLTLANRLEDGTLSVADLTQTIDKREVRETKNIDTYVAPVERAQYIVAIREVGYQPTMDFSTLNADDSRLGYNPQLELIYDQPVVIAQLTDDETVWGQDLTANASQTGASSAAIAMVKTAAADKPYNSYFSYGNNAIAEDILNAQTAYNEFGASHYVAGDWGKLGAFTAYIEVELGNCYEIFDPMLTRFFNVRVERPVFFGTGAGKITADAYNVEKDTEVTLSFNDWRNYGLSNTNADETKVKADYYVAAIDAFTGAIDWSNGKLTTLNESLLNEIRTDVGELGGVFEQTIDPATGNTIRKRVPFGVTTTKQRIAINLLPVASKFSANAAIGNNAQLDVTINGNKIVYRNIDNNVDAFNLYVPIYWSYVFGNGELEKNILPAEVNIATYLKFYGEDYENADVNGLDKFKYVYFREQRPTIWAETGLDENTHDNHMDWAVISVVKTVKH